MNYTKDQIEKLKQRRIKGKELLSYIDARKEI